LIAKSEVENSKNCHISIFGYWCVVIYISRDDLGYTFLKKH
jgi:hypothetical protein